MSYTTDNSGPARAGTGAGAGASARDAWRPRRASAKAARVRVEAAGSTKHEQRPHPEVSGSRESLRRGVRGPLRAPGALSTRRASQPAEQQRSAAERCFARRASNTTSSEVGRTAPAQTRQRTGPDPDPDGRRRTRPLPSAAQDVLHTKAFPPRFSSTLPVPSASSARPHGHGTEGRGAYRDLRNDLMTR